MKPGGSRQKGFALLSPWLWLGFGVMLALAGFTGYRQGVKVTKAEYEEATRKAMTAMIDRHNELARVDSAAAVKAEKIRQDRRVKQLEKRHDFELEAARNHRTECSWSDLELGLFNSLIDIANGEADASVLVPRGLRPPAEAEGEKRRGGKGLGGRGNGFIWRMSEPPR